MHSKVVILFGGTSSERRVSVASAQHIASTCPGAALWFWAPTGSVHEVTAETLASFARPFETDFDPRTAPSSPDLEGALDRAPRGAVFFLALHGGSGEDGTVQRLLEARRLAFTGSSSASARSCFDKRRARDLVANAGLRVAEARDLLGREAAQARHELLEWLGRAGRLVKKPACDGSSVGLGFLSTAADLERFVAEAATTPETAFLIERFIEGTELTVGVLEQDGRVIALPCSEVRLDRGRSFDYAGKYLGVGTREITPAEVPAEVHQRAGEVALRAHRVLGCRGYSRTDLILEPSGELTFLEINNLPGLTRASFIPQQLTAANLDMPGFVAGQLELARARNSDRAPRDTTVSSFIAAL